MVFTTYLSLSQFRNALVECDEDREGRLVNCRAESVEHAERPFTVQNGVFIRDLSRERLLGEKETPRTGTDTDLIEIDTPKGKVRVLYPGGG